MQSVQFRMLGGLEVHDGGRPVDLGGPKQRAVLAALLLEPGRPHAPIRLIDEVWHDSAPRSAEVSLQAYISNLRRVLEPDRKPRQAPRVLVTQPAGYALVVDRSEVDVNRFEDLAHEGHALLRDGDPRGAAETLDAALAERAGPLLPELADEPWVEADAVRLDHIRARAIEDRFDAGLALGEHRELLPRIEASVAEEPFREHLRYQLALALYRSGRQRDALASLQAARSALVDEVGIEPGPELRSLEADILAQHPGLVELPDVGTARRLPAVGDRRTGSVADPAPASGRRPGGFERSSDRAPVTAVPGDAGTSDTPADRDDHRADPTGRPCLGRERELIALREAYAAAAAGAGRPVVISGEAGIGKTRLVEELVSQLPDATVAWARCPETASQAAFWPCIQIGRQLEGAGAIDADLAAALLPESDAPTLDRPERDRLWLHVAVAKALATATRPVVIVVDDIQWADAGSLRVLEYVCGELRNTPVLLIATARPPGPGAPAALIDCLGELARQPDARRIDLGGLDTEAVGEWVDDRSGGTGSREVAGLIHARTGGNPFFVSEVVELLAGDDRLGDADAVRRDATVPAAVNDVIRRRVSRLDPESQRLLAAASIIGPSFDIDVVAAVTDRAVPEALDLLDPALAAGLIDETDVPGRFAFAHALAAQALAAEASAATRARTHARTCEVIADLRRNDIAGHLTELAHHAFEGLAAGTAPVAYDWSVRAARQEAGRLAHEAAAEHWGRAVRALEMTAPSSPTARYEALLEQGFAHVRAGALDAAYEALVRAIDLALAADDLALVARAAAAMHLDGLWFPGEIGLADPDAMSALQRALAAMTAEPTRERALALSALADNAYWSWPADRLDAVSAEAVAVARTVGEPEVLGRTLQKRSQVLWRAEAFGPRRAASDELLALIHRGEAPPELAAIGLFGAAGVAWEQGEVHASEQLIREARRTAGELGSPALTTQLDFFQATLHTWRGRLHEAHESIDRAYELYRRTRRWSADAFRAGFKMILWMEQGRIDDVAAVAPDLVASPYGKWFLEAYAFVLTEVGRLDEARELIGDRPPPLEDNWLYLGVIAAATHTRVALGDEDGVRALQPLLDPNSGRLGAAGIGLAFGDIDLARGRAARLLGDHDTARRCADASVALTRSSDAGPWLVRSLLFRAELTGADDDHRAAAAVVDRLDLPLLRSRL